MKHLKEANTQRRAMNAFVAALKKDKAPEDPPLKFELCYIPEVFGMYKDRRLPLFDKEEVKDGSLLHADWAYNLQEDGVEEYGGRNGWFKPSFQSSPTSPRTSPNSIRISPKFYNTQNKGGCVAESC